MPTHGPSRTRATVALTALASAALALVAPAASAHVSPTDDELVAGASGLVELAVSHGCGEAGTVRVAIQIPDGIDAVTPTVNPGWEVVKVMEDLAEPIVDAHGEETTERVDQVVYSTGTPLAHDQRTTFTLSLRAPDAPGETIYFPTVQTCEEGETAWIQIPAEGQDPSELDEPAPAIHVVEGDGGGDHHDDDGDDATDGAVEEAAVDGSPVAATTADDDDDGTDALTVVALAVGIAGLAVGGTALVAARRRP